jgi:hypothetical protein
MNKKFNLKFSGESKLSENIAFLDVKEMVKAEDLGGGKIRFSVNLPEGASYYSISMGEQRRNKENKLVSNHTFYSDSIRDREYVLDTSKELQNGMWAGLSYGSDGVDPYQWIEPFYHTGDYVYHVTAYDSKGDILADSEGIYPVKSKQTFRIQASEWSDADHMLLQRKYDEAIKQYEMQAEQHGKDALHAAKVLAKLYGSGWIYNSKEFRLEGKDDLKARKYLEILDGKINSDYVKSSLAAIYSKDGEYGKALAILLKLAEKSGYAYWEVGRIYSYMGDYTKAEEAYRKFYDQTGRGAAWLMMLYVLEGKDDMLTSWAPRHENSSYYADYVKLVDDYIIIDRSKYAAFFSLIRNGNTAEAEKSIKDDDGDLALLYKGLLRLQKPLKDYTEREKDYTDLYKKVKSPELRNIMKYFGRDGVNSGFGFEN